MISFPPLSKHTQGQLKHEQTSLGNYSSEAIISQPLKKLPPHASGLVHLSSSAHCIGCSSGQHLPEPHQRVLEGQSHVVECSIHCVVAEDNWCLFAKTTVALSFPQFSHWGNLPGILSTKCAFLAGSLNCCSFLSYQRKAFTRATVKCYNFRLYTKLFGIYKHTATALRTVSSLPEVCVWSGVALTFSVVSSTNWIIIISANKTLNSKVEPVLKDQPIGHKNMVSQER